MRLDGGTAHIVRWIDGHTQHGARRRGSDLSKLWREDDVHRDRKKRNFRSMRQLQRAGRIHLGTDSSVAGSLADHIVFARAVPVRTPASRPRPQTSCQAVAAASLSISLDYAFAPPRVVPLAHACGVADGRAPASRLRTQSSNRPLRPHPIFFFLLHPVQGWALPGVRGASPAFGCARGRDDPARVHYIRVTNAG